nr:hypothetical protein [Pararhodospirillum photometricum]
MLQGPQGGEKIARAGLGQADLGLNAGVSGPGHRQAAQTLQGLFWRHPAQHPHQPRPRQGIAGAQGQRALERQSRFAQPALGLQDGAASEMGIGQGGILAGGAGVGFQGIIVQAGAQGPIALIDRVLPPAGAAGDHRRLDGGGLLLLRWRLRGPTGLGPGAGRRRIRGRRQAHFRGKTPQDLRVKREALLVVVGGPYGQGKQQGGQS